MEPIVLNSAGETLKFDTSFATGNDMPFGRMSLICGTCGEEAEFMSASPTYNFILCSHCGRKPDPAFIPVEVDTPRKLRQWCANRIAEKEALKKALDRPFFDPHKHVPHDDGPDGLVEIEEIDLGPNKP